MTGYLVSRGMRLESIGFWRGVSSAIGLAGTLAYDISVKRLSLVTTGMWSIVYQWSCLSIGLASVFVTDNRIALAMLIGSVCCSRIGLWVFDISVTQLMQEQIPSGIRGMIGGTQKSLNSFFQFLSYGMGIVFSNPQTDFPLYVFAGYAAVRAYQIL